MLRHRSPWNFLPVSAGATQNYLPASSCHHHTVPDLVFDNVQETKVVNELHEMQEAKGSMQP